MDMNLKKLKKLLKNENYKNKFKDLLIIKQKNNMTKEEV